jgi:hypothetical protein
MRGRISVYPDADPEIQLRTVIDAAARQPLHQFISPISEAKLIAGGLTAESRALLVFWWHRHWLLLPPIPSFLLVSGKRADQVNLGTYRKRA